mmetsp:Transcript_57193/g.147114  ORF Transcript_57193/g.147114 Transcript_57193/m.147114 type:complete len:266 (-) Transcript_57193:63-860(-)
MQELQVELKAAKEKWGKEVELQKAEKGEPDYPFPVCITRYTPRAESAAMWDIEELPVRLVVHSAEVENKPVSVEVAPYFPGELPEHMEKAIETEWKKMLKKKDRKQLWQVEKLLQWVEDHFAEMMRLVPAYIDNYEGCDDMGASMRRYTLVGPAAPEEEEEEDEEDLTEEEQERRVQEYLAREEARIEAETDAKLAEAEEKRKMAEKGLLEDGEKARTLSKAEKAELAKSRKERSGQRWRKTGSKSHKPEHDEKALKNMPGHKKK